MQNNYLSSRSPSPQPTERVKNRWTPVPSQGYLGRYQGWDLHHLVPSSEGTHIGPTVNDSAGFQDPDDPTMRAVRVSDEHTPADVPNDHSKPAPRTIKSMRRSYQTDDGLSEFLSSGDRTPPPSSRRPLVFHRMELRSTGPYPKVSYKYIDRLTGKERTVSEHKAKQAGGEMMAALEQFWAAKPLMKRSRVLRYLALTTGNGEEVQYLL